MGAIWQDVRFGWRMLWKHRLVSSVCVIALALGIGANAAIFSLAEAFLLHPVPFENADRIVALVDTHAGTGSVGGEYGPEDMNPIAPATYLDWKKEARSFDEITAYAWNEVNLTGDRTAQKVQSFEVPANFFDTIGVRPESGPYVSPRGRRTRQGSGNCAGARLVGAAICLGPKCPWQEHQGGRQELYRCRGYGQGF